MNALLIVLGALAVGKIHGQDAVNSFNINSQLASVSSNQRPVIYKEISEELQPPPPPSRQPFYYDSYRTETLDNSKLIAPSRQTTREKERIIAISTTKKPTKMDLPTNKINESHQTNKTNNTTAARNNNRHNEDLEAVTSPPKPEQPVKPQNKTAGDNVVSPESPATTLAPTPSTNVTFDERSNFNGDQCPTGYVKVNGKCVESD